MKTKIIDSKTLLLPSCTIELPDGKQLRFTTSPISLGSSPSNDLVLPMETISRQHCVLRFVPGGIMVRDLGSTNGTKLDRITIDRARIDKACKLILGDIELKLIPGEDFSEELPSKRDSLEGMLGESDGMKRLFSWIEKVAPSDLPVLFEAETGCGKDMAARAVHNLSGRAKGPFVVVDCSCLSGALMESELFGHVKGSFTGAIAGKAGLVELASGGSLFLDEIGELPLELQSKLLRLLENKSYRPVGSGEQKDSDARVIAATNRNLEAEVRAGRFRQDLLYRLEVIKLRIPPLRERREDIALLANHFLDDKAFSNGAMAKLCADSWPGNVRQLFNRVQRAALLSDTEEIQISDLLDTDFTGQPSENITTRESSFREAKAAAGAVFEREYLKNLIEQSGGRISTAAKNAEMDRKHLRELLKKHDLYKPSPKH